MDELVVGGGVGDVEMHCALEIGDGFEEVSSLAAVLEEEGGDLGVGGGFRVPFGDEGVGMGHFRFQH